MSEILLEPDLQKTGKNDMLQNSTGLYCHKSHILCGHFVLAITTLMRLYNKQLDWHIYWSKDPNDPNAQPPWQEKTIIDGWESEQALHQAFKRMLDALDMRWSKVMHHAEITSMSKHVISTLDDCYITQLLPVTLKVMAGFEKDETYHVNSLMCQVLHWINW
jgi:hypothetical protein